MRLSVNYINEGFGRVSASGMTIDAGVQYENFLDVEGLDIAAIRVGYLLDAEDAKDDKDTPDIDESTMLENIFAGPSFGATLNLQKLIGVDLSIDYAMFMTEYFDDNHVVSLRFGK